uniref:Uncharacterized protein n=1 Tax=Romanomermis culicivorax TaxID=13658 RepID=A0A915IK32_ROMCU
MRKNFKLPALLLCQRSAASRWSFIVNGCEITATGCDVVAGTNAEVNVIGTGTFCIVDDDENP